MHIGVKFHLFCEVLPGHQPTVFLCSLWTPTSLTFSSIYISLGTWVNNMNHTIFQYGICIGISTYKLLNSKDPALTSLLVTMPLVWSWTHGNSLAITWVDLNSNHCLATGNNTAWFTFLRVDGECLEVVKLWAPLKPCNNIIGNYTSSQRVASKTPMLGPGTGASSHPLLFNVLYVSPLTEPSWGLAILG